MSTNPQQIKNYAKNISIYIPYLDINISKYAVRRVFDRLNLGRINTVVFINNKNSRRAYIYFNSWYTNPTAVNIKKRIIDGDSVTIVTDPNDTLYWKCYLNNRYPKNCHYSKRR
jgi:hypothetical protein